MATIISRALRLRDNQLPMLQSEHLFALTKEVRIQHEGEEYRLRLTRNNRLILTK
ncbi:MULTISPECIES: hemin uptake protein HemP [Psychrobacter]|uniref:Hemin uptake protein HemP n=3 Tax=Psychrobacter TaxID=497 RepID=A0A844M0D7_9GAMM|nr:MULTISPECIES: hemin uptake protein HemP [Psychrobacter]AWT49354.1 hemin uptake protein HemP [Psychrobacter sp. YP14]MUG32140.1 hemin uptake protein HemP [Psychrobacter sanguinis]UNK04678.1 hemin uptake protein HemP [Psychrobacter sp. PraFG1]